jgi:uncharacterized repeat protein (TIGR03806 family)
MSQRRQSFFFALILGSVAAAASCGDDGAGTGGGDGSTSGEGAASSSSSSASVSSSSASGGGEGGAPAVSPTPPDEAEPWELLSEWNLFRDGPAQEPALRVVPYDVIAPLFSDYAAKLRFLHVPEGSTIAYAEDGPWGFPVGTVLVKTFAYPADARDPSSPLRLMETRLLWRLDDGWKALTYVWNEEQTDAEKTSAGTTVPIEWIDEQGDPRALDYVVPNTNQCKECHSIDEALETLGGLTLQLDRDGQIEALAELGWLDQDPPAERSALVDPFGDDDVILRARSYLHANCSSCHIVGGTASQSSLLLDFASSDPETDPSNVGICKIPTSAGGATCGHTFDVVPGDPDASIMICRVASEDTEVRMPPLARQLVHEEGVALLRDFIDALPPADCE